MFFDFLNSSQARSLKGISFACFLWSLSSCMVFTILPTFITEELKLSPLFLGTVEGFALFLAFSAKILSGVLSDYIQKRKPLLVLGTLLSILFKILFSLATHGGWIIFAKSLDRFAKGIRSAPADALIAETTPDHHRGSAFGFRQSCYVSGALIGSLIASFLLTYSQHNYRFVFACAVFPVFLSLIIILYGVTDVSSGHTQINDFQKHQRLSFKDFRHLPLMFWCVIGVSFVLMLARFSDSFMALKARSVGLDVTIIPLFMMGNEIAHAALALPAGWLSDRFNRFQILSWGIGVLCLTNLVFYHATSLVSVFIGFIMAGVHMGLTHSLLSSIISGYTIRSLQASAFSIYYCSTGIAVLCANPIAGYLSTCYDSSSIPFLYGGIASTFALILLRLLIQYDKKHTNRPF